MISSAILIIQAPMFCARCQLIESEGGRILGELVDLHFFDTVSTSALLDASEETTWTDGHWADVWCMEIYVC